MRLLTALITSLFIAIGASAQKDTGIMLDHSIGYYNAFLYKDMNGEWLTENEWVEMYGRRAFRDTYPFKTDYSHIKEHYCIRWNYKDALSLSSTNTLYWSRIFTTDASIDALMEIAASKFENAKIYDNKVIGYLADKNFQDFRIGICTLNNAIWQAKITYEFKEGRYKVTVENIQYKFTVIYTGTFSEVPHYDSLYTLLYDTMGTKRVWYDPFINSIDYTFCNELYLSTPSDEDIDW